MRAARVLRRCKASLESLRKLAGEDPSKPPLWLPPGPSGPSPPSRAGPRAGPPLEPSCDIHRWNKILARSFRNVNINRFLFTMFAHTGDTWRHSQESPQPASASSAAAIGQRIFCSSRGSSSRGCKGRFCSSNRGSSS